jgi:2-polyprenyl-6-methoxyphenol hydroxylase-like FAD-dependent oxidoreductase
MKRMLISGSGIAGLTLACCMATFGWEVVVVEKAPRERTDGYMLVFFGNGWKVAGRMNLLEDIKEIRYPFDSFHIVDSLGKTYFRVPIDRVVKGFGGEFTYLRRPDLERILLERTKELAVPIRYGTTLTSLKESSRFVTVTFQDHQEETFDLVVGADGVHSRVRQLAFGDESNFSHYLGYAAAAFQAPLHEEIRGCIKIYQEPNRLAIFYPISDTIMDAVFLFRFPGKNRVSNADYRNVLLEKYAGSQWILEEVLKHTATEKIAFFDNLEQIRVPHWSSGRISLVGDACGCLTLVAGQGATMAMLESYTLASELQKNTAFEIDFKSYESLMKLEIKRRQVQAENFAGNFFQSSVVRMKMFRLFGRMAFSPLFMHTTANFFKGKIFLS